MAGRFRRQALVTTAVIAHLIVVVFHGRAHSSLGVALSNWQRYYVFTVILGAPIVALALSFTRFERPGLWLLLLAMLGSLIFGAVFHYIVISHDHVAHLPAGEARGVFRMTALLLVVTEAFGVVAAALGLRRQDFRMEQD